MDLLSSELALAGRPACAAWKPLRSCACCSAVGGVAKAGDRSAEGSGDDANEKASSPSAARLFRLKSRIEISRSFYGIQLMSSDGC
eukprot:5994450-Prymnesium_polylepis.2